MFFVQKHTFMKINLPFSKRKWNKPTIFKFQFMLRWFKKKKKKKKKKE